MRSRTLLASVRGAPRLPRPQAGPARQGGPLAAFAARPSTSRSGGGCGLSTVPRAVPRPLPGRVSPAPPRSAERKAYTAVSWNAPASEPAGRLERAPALKDVPGTLFLAGGPPVTAKGAPVAGIGVAGAPSGALDERYAQAGAAVLGR
ncbi:heme-binding protein [Streptomyces sp. FXJ1.172]|uniref:heme-binding protein n=1 Tax=Streptomyces sp. FXJ1.172 TaxID=710705 RepID=UPI003FA7DB7E